MISEKIKIQKYKKIIKGTKNVRNLHIHRTLQILHLFKVFQICWGSIWVGCCLNRFIILRRWWRDFRKNPNLKILKNLQGYEECEEFSHSSYPSNSPLVWSFSNLLGFHMVGCFLNSFITHSMWSNDFRKNPNPKILKH